MRIQVRFFASLREAVGSSNGELELESGATVREALAALRAAHPKVSDARFAVAVNRGYAAESTPLAEGDEIALIPPVSGG